MAVTAEGGARRGWILVLWAGLAAGALDILFACVFWAIKSGVQPQRIFQSVAAGLLGPASFDGGPATAALGLVLQFFIATMMAAAYYLPAQRSEPLRRRPVAYGAAYGLVLYVIMNFVVVPLSAAQRGSLDPLWVGLSIVAHVTLIGIPIAVICTRPWRSRRDTVAAAAPV